jgi:muramoyltetrapeptide carboxypeptidase LdcA involved in peptidoglycan recycling
MKIPNKLCKGDEIRIIAPSESASIISSERIIFAEKKLKSLGFKVTYGKNIFIEDNFDLINIKKKVEDLLNAFKDKNVKAILSMVGGSSSNQLLKYIDWNIIQNNPKIFCGYSDIDTLSLSIRKKGDFITYSGLHFSTFSQKKYFDFTQDYFIKCLVSSDQYDIIPSLSWSDDLWYLNQNKREIIKNEGWWVINQGRAKGEILGSNISSFVLLKGTTFMPSFKNTILFLEKDNSSGDNTLKDFSRLLQSIIDIPTSHQIKGIVIGRFQKKSNILKEDLINMIKSKKQLINLPIIANVDLGHTDPKIIIPIGGTALLEATNQNCQLKILKH